MVFSSTVFLFLFLPLVLAGNALCGRRFRNLFLLLASLIDLRESVWAEGQQLFEKWKPLVSRRAFLVSGLNLCCYLALRRRDLRPIARAFSAVAGRNGHPASADSTVRAATG